MTHSSTINTEIMRILLFKIGSRDYPLGRNLSSECTRMTSFIIGEKEIGRIGKKEKKGREFKEKNSSKKDKLKFGLKNRLNQPKNRTNTNLSFNLKCRARRNHPRTKVW